MGRVEAHVDDLPHRRDGDAGVIRTPSGLEMGLTWNEAEEVWIGQPTISMRQIINLGMRTTGLPANWKYPGAFTETGPLADQRGYGFQIHEVTDPLPYEMWQAGLRLQEHLSAEMKLAADPEAGPPEIALNWYELAEGEDFLSPTPVSQGVRLVGDTNLDTYRWHSSGWQNSPVAEPLAESHWYPELYTLHGGVNFRHLTARHRWVGGPGIGELGSVERPSQYPALENVVSWHRARDVAAADTVAFSTWTDYSGRGRHLTQPTSAKRPNARRDTPGGMRYVRFNGAQCLRTSLLTTSQPVTVILVMRQQATGGTQQVWMGPNGSGAALLYRGDATNQVNVWAGGTDLTYDRGSAWPSPWMIWSVVLDGDNTTVWENLTEVASGDAGDFGFGGLVLGANNDESLPARIDVAELIVANSAVGDTAREDLVNALNDRYEIF